MSFFYYYVLLHNWVNEGIDITTYISNNMQVIREMPDQQANREPMQRQDHLDQRDHPDHLEKPDPPDHREIQEHQLSMRCGG